MTTTSIRGRGRPELGVVATYLRELRQQAARPTVVRPRRGSDARAQGGLGMRASSERRGRTPQA